MHWSNLWTILRRRSQLEGIDSRTLRRLMRRLRPPWRRSLRTLTSRKESIWQSRRFNCRTGFSVEDRYWHHDLRILSGNWSTLSCSWLFRSIHYCFTWRRYSGFWYQVRSSFYYQQVRFATTNFWKVCTRCEWESLINSKQYWQCSNKKSNNIYRRVTRSLRP